jgi:hypothetical protein
MEDSGPWKHFISQKLRERDKQEQIPFAAVFDACTPLYSLLFLFYIVSFRQWDRFLLQKDPF